MKKSKLGQFYTPDYISSIMAEQVTRFSEKEPLKVIDMACGNGSLLSPLKKILSKSEFNACDIDEGNIEYLKSVNPSWNTQNIDSLSHQFETNFYDIAVGNPPFIKTLVTKHIIDLLDRRYDGYLVKLGHSIRAEIVFIAKYIESTKIGGMISLIIPESIISNEKMKFVRASIFKSLSNISLYEISSRYFDSAEVKTYLLSGKKTTIPDSKILIGKITSNGELVNTREVLKDYCLERADINYLSHIDQINALMKRYRSLGEVMLSLDRGSKTKNQLEKEDAIFFHTSSFKEFSTSEVKLNGNIGLTKKYNPRHVAKKNDILIPRVGRKCHQHQVLINDGHAVLTDSVFRLNLPEKISPIVFESLMTEENQLWRDVHSKGSCTKLLTKRDMMRMPIIGLNR